MTDIQPFRIEVSDQQLGDLKQRLALTRLQQFFYTTLEWLQLMSKTTTYH